MGFMMTTMVVADRYQNGVPCATMLSSCEDATTIQLVIETVRRAANMEFEFFMIDKSPTEMKAVQAAGHKFLLCKFHTMQAFERYLRTSQVRPAEASSTCFSTHVFVDTMVSHVLPAA